MQRSTLKIMVLSSLVAALSLSVPGHAESPIDVFHAARCAEILIAPGSFCLLNLVPNAVNVSLVLTPPAGVSKEPPELQIIPVTLEAVGAQGSALGIVVTPFARVEVWVETAGPAGETGTSVIEHEEVQSGQTWAVLWEPNSGKDDSVSRYVLRPAAAGD